MSERTRMFWRAVRSGLGFGRRGERAAEARLKRVLEEKRIEEARQRHTEGNTP